MSTPTEPDPSVPALPTPSARKGRGTIWAIDHRYASVDREAYDDGWSTLAESALEEPPASPTEVLDERVRTILSSNDSPDVGFDLSINSYRGCEHEMWNSSGGLRKGE